MRYIIGLLAAVFAVPVCGQETIKADAGPLASNWSKLGPAGEGPRGFTLHSRGIRLNKSGQYELWIKIVPANAAAFVKRYALPRSTDHVLQYATVDCAKKQLMLEKTAVYDSGNKVLETGTSALTPASKKDMVKPGSIGEALYKYVCEEPVVVPQSEQ